MSAPRYFLQFQAIPAYWINSYNVGFIDYSTDLSSSLKYFVICKFLISNRHQYDQDSD